MSKKKKKNTNNSKIKNGKTNRHLAINHQLKLAFKKSFLTFSKLPQFL